MINGSAAPGYLRDASTGIDVIDPSDESILATVPAGTAADASRAVSAAAGAAEGLGQDLAGRTAAIPAAPRRRAGRQRGRVGRQHHRGGRRSHPGRAGRAGRPGQSP